MMFNDVVASNSNMFPAWFLIFALFSIYVASVPSHTDRGVRLYDGKGLIRRRRAVCVDGTYENNNRNCCLCGAGQRLKKHCTLSPDDRTCDFCEEGTYNSHPNFQLSCEPCTECSLNANLEVRESCGPASDTKCRCKEHHFCSIFIEESCKLCIPCRVCGADGISVACTATSDTVCNDKSEGGNKSYIVLSIVLPLLILIIVGIVLGVFCRKRKRMRQQNITEQTNGNEEMRLLRAPRVDLSPHLPDIAEVIGWNDMEAVAMRTGVPDTTIEACKLDYPGQSQQQTQQLLKTWVEREGMEASEKLINVLQNSGKRSKAERVVDILPAA